METNKIYKQKSDEAPSGTPNPRGTGTPGSNHGHAGTRKQKECNEQPIPDSATSKESRLAGKPASQELGEGVGTPILASGGRQENPLRSEHKASSLLGARTHGGSSTDTGLPAEAQNGQPLTSHSATGTAAPVAGASGGGVRHLSNKSDSNLNPPQPPFGGSQPGQARNGAPGLRQQSDGKKKRKNSEKAQRRASHNRKGEREEDRQPRAANGTGIPPIDGAQQNTQGGGSQPRSHSRGAAGSHQAQAQPGQQNQQDRGQAQYMHINQQNQQQFFDASNFNPFAGAQNGFPFGNGGGGPFLGGGQQAPQVHFIAKKQQFIAQISPDQLMNGDKRPYTAQSFNNLSANAKRAGSVYANAMSSTTKTGHHGYNLANAGFTSHPAVYVGNMGSRTHTNGFSFHPPGQGATNHLHKYANSIYAEEVKPKVAGKDILQALASSNGFSSGYGSDPYNSVMSGGLPATITHSAKPTKGKAQNRLLAREKEQLYDDAIKMKMLNNQMKEDNVKLKTKVKILENELSRKEKTIEDLFSHNQLIQQSHQKHQTNSNQSLMPLAQTAQKYQQETFLVMSLKKQIRELKYEVVKRDEELEILRKNIKNTRTKEFEQEIQTYHDECLRLRAVMEDIIKQGSSHPIHQQPFLEQVSVMQSELSQKDMLIRQLTESLNSQVQLDKSFNPAGSTHAAGPGQTQLAAVKSQESQNFETHPSEMANSSAAGNGQGGREKSVEKKHPLATGATPGGKDLQKELQRMRKMLREKEKDTVKMRAELGQLKKECQEKQKSELVHNRDAETQLKTLKEKLKDQKSEVKRREEKLGDSESRIRKLEEQLRGQVDQMKAQEEATKQLKAQLRAAKHQKAKLETKQDSKQEPQLEASEGAPSRQASASALQATTKSTDALSIPRGELAAITLIGQREKLCRDDLTAMMLAGEESLKMLIREPSDQLINYIKANLTDEDALLTGIPRFEMPKVDFESQVLREMRIVLRDNSQRIAELTREELLPWAEFETFYHTLDNFEYPHKDKLLEFIKYFFLDHIVSENVLMMNYQAFKEHLLARRPPGTTPEKSRNGSNLRSGRKSGESSGSQGASAEEMMKRRLLATGGSDDDRHAEEERMLDIAEQCFMRIADLLHVVQKTVRAVFLRYSSPEEFKDGSILELMSPRGFLEGVRELGFEDVTELEAACLMKVLAKPELENAVILNEFVLIMENFGIPAIIEEDEYENDYFPDSDAEPQESDKKENEEKSADKPKKQPEAGGDTPSMEAAEPLSPSKDHLRPEPNEKLKKFAEIPKSKKKNPITIKFDVLDEKGMKILKKLARFLLERYMHPREFFGPTIKKQEFGLKKQKVEVIKLHDFYLRLKLASIRKKLKENVTLNLFLAIAGTKHPGFIQVKRMIKGLEVIAEGEQELIIKEQEAKEKEELENIEKENAERAANGLPPLTEEEIFTAKLEKEKDAAKKKGEKVDEKEAEGAPPGKPPTGMSKAEMDKMVKLGAKSSPKEGEKGARNRFASHLGAQTQLNTIEEDLHETQTSHYSYKLKQGEDSDRDSRHGLSTSHHLRNSNALNELDDSSRRSAGAARGSLPLGGSVGSGDYSGGSQSGSKKGRDIDANNIAVNDFKPIERRKSDMVQVADRMLHVNHESGTTDLRKQSIKEELIEDEITYKVGNSGCQSMKHESTKPPTADTDLEQQQNNIMNNQQPTSQMIDDMINAQNNDSDADQKMKDELDAEVDKKYNQKIQQKTAEENEEEYDEDEFADDDKDPLKEDTILTDKVEAMVNRENAGAEKAVNTGAQETKEDEYSYHDDDSQYSEIDNNIQIEEPKTGAKNQNYKQPVNNNDDKADDSQEEDYEF